MNVTFYFAYCTQYTIGKVGTTETEAPLLLGKLSLYDVILPSSANTLQIREGKKFRRVHTPHCTQCTMFSSAVTGGSVVVRLL